MQEAEIKKLKRSGRPDLVWCGTPPAPDAGLPPVLFLGGFRSDMAGTKALFLEHRCRLRGQEFVRFDYSGHGQSGGAFEDGCIGDWKDDALAVLESCVGPGPAVLAGSSMGGWISLLLALERPERVRGVLGIAAAPDFTLDIRARMTPDQAAEMARTGRLEVANPYSPAPYVFTRRLLEDGDARLVLDRTHDLALPMVFVQGMKDAEVPWQTPFRVRKAFPKADVQVFLIEEGGHRLSEPDELLALDTRLEELSKSLAD